MSKVLKILLPLVIFFVIIAAGLGYYVVSQLQPVDASKTNKVSFTVNKGESASEIGTQLESKGLIKNATAFRLLVMKNNLGTKIQSGSFLLSPSMTVQQISLALTSAPTSIRITIKQGLRREEMATFLATQDLTKFDKAEFLDLTKGQEGYLFPDTYQVSREASTKSLADLFRTTFEKKVTQGIADEIQKSPHSLKDAVIMGSILEREAKRPTATDPDPTDMKMVAGILWNRIEAGIPLSVDSSLEYVGGYNTKEQTWWSESSVINNKLSSSLYNTYKYQGLPPTPISNPALAAIDASLAPIQNNYLYYLYGNDNLIHYARTLDEHNRNIDKYLR